MDPPFFFFLISVYNKTSSLSTPKKEFALWILNAAPIFGNTLRALKKQSCFTAWETARKKFLPRARREGSRFPPSLQATALSEDTASAACPCVPGARSRSFTVPTESSFCSPSARHAPRFWSALTVSPERQSSTHPTSPPLATDSLTGRFSRRTGRSSTRRMPFFPMRNRAKSLRTCCVLS